MHAMCCRDNSEPPSVLLPMFGTNEGRDPRISWFATPTSKVLGTDVMTAAILGTGVYGGGRSRASPPLDRAALLAEAVFLAD
jgi:hypothetical protein